MNPLKLVSYPSKKKNKIGANPIVMHTLVNGYWRKGMPEQKKNQLDTRNNDLKILMQVRSLLETLESEGIPTEKAIERILSPLITVASRHCHLEDTVSYVNDIVVEILPAENWDEFMSGIFRLHTKILRSTVMAGSATLAMRLLRANEAYYEKFCPLASHVEERIYVDICDELGSLTGAVKTEICQSVDPLKPILPFGNRMKHWKYVNEKYKNVLLRIDCLLARLEEYIRDTKVYPIFSKDRLDGILKEYMECLTVLESARKLRYDLL